MPYKTNYEDIALGIVCPMANERDNAVPFVTDVLDVCGRFPFRSVRMFVILDRKSTDGTLDMLRGVSCRLKELTVVYAPENKCVVDAYVRGYREALEAGSDWILEIDAGYSHQPEDIPGHFAKMIEGYDCVFGSRFCTGGDSTGVSFIRYALSKGGSVVANLLLGTRLKDMTSGFELFSCNTLSAVMTRGIKSRGPFFQTEIKAYLGRLNIAEVPIRYKNASHVLTHKSLEDSLSGLWRLFLLRLSNRLFVTIDRQGYSRHDG